MAAKRKQPFASRQFVDDCAFIEGMSPDVLVDLGVLTHVMVKRDWYGRYEGWADVPAAWLAKASRMGFRRVRASLQRLTDWGMITPMSTNGKFRHLALKYRYDTRRNKLVYPDDAEPTEVEDQYEEPEVVEEPESEPEPEPEPKPVRKPVAMARGKEKQRCDWNFEKKGFWYTIWTWDDKAQTMVECEVEYNTFTEETPPPECTVCDCQFHPTEGRGVVHPDMCTECSLEAEKREKSA